MTCERCQAEQERADRIAADLHSAEQDLVHKRREIKRLNTLLKNQTERDPGAKLVTEILQYWQKATNHPKAKIPLNGERADKVRGRLKDFTPDQLKEALEGYARFPYVRDAERVSTGDDLTERFDDAELIFRNEKTVENGIKLLARARAEEQKVVQLHRETPLDQLLHALRRQYGPDCYVLWPALTIDECAAGLIPSERDEWWAPCPLHEGTATRLRIREPLEVKCCEGCDPQAILAALHCSEERVAA